MFRKPAEDRIEDLMTIPFVFAEVCRSIDISRLEWARRSIIWRPLSLFVLAKMRESSLLFGK